MLLLNVHKAVLCAEGHLTQYVVSGEASSNMSAQLDKDVKKHQAAT